jgi:hypothetical protein
MPRSRLFVVIESRPIMIEDRAGTPSTTCSSLHSPPPKRGRFNSPYSSPGQPEAAEADITSPPLTHYVSIPEKHLLLSATSQEASPSPASTVPSHGSNAPSGSQYSERSNYSDVSALVDVAKREPVTMQLVSAYLSAVFNGTDNGTSVPVDYAADPQEMESVKD